MKMNRIVSILTIGAGALAFAACHNSEQTFPDYEGGTTAYFAYQYPIRTMILGNVETYDNTSDNDGRFTIYGTCGGSYSGLNAKIDVSVDKTLVENLYFEDGTPVKVMPDDYYKFTSELQLDYAGGFRGGVDVQLTDKFFADDASLKTTYVIPLVMGNFSGVDSVLRGSPKGGNPARQNVNEWKVAPKDYVLFCVNYINKYNATYIRRGVERFDKLQFEDKEIGRENTIVIHATKKTENPWDCQFWIDVDHTFAQGEKWELSMDIKAAQNASIGSQIHKNVGEYLSNGNIGAVGFAMDWTHFSKSGTFAKEDAGGHSIAFNLNDNPDANDYYLDNISFKINGTEYITNIECNNVECKNFYTKINKGQTVASEYGEVILYKKDTIGHAKVTNNRHVGEFVENGDIIYTTSKTAKSIVLPIRANVDEEMLTCNLVLDFDNSGNCTLTSETDGCVAEGSGKYVENGAIKAWGDKDRDVLYLDYTLDFGTRFGGEKVFYEVKDTLVWRDRGAAAGVQQFYPHYSEQ